jgi:conjugative transfer signal peptidase TraF
MNRPVLWLTGAGLGLVLSGVFSDPADRLIWNRTGSAPTGLYWLSDGPFTPGRWVVVSARSDQANWAEAYGFVGRDWPLLKQVAGISGDEICRNGQDIVINNKHAGTAHTADSMGQNLPVWQGCIRLPDHMFFLMNAHPDSLDGRYFGPTHRQDLDGVAVPLFTLNH